MMTEVEAPPRKGRKAIAWRLVGTYTSKEDLLAAKKTEKVSKRKSDELRIGTKVTYRCNSWKRTRCQYQMYALYGADGSIRLYEGGQHDHGKVRVPGAQPKLSLLEATTSEELQEFRKASPEQPVTTAAEREAANTLHALANAGMTSQDEFLANLIQQATSMAASTPAEINGGLNMEAFVSGDPNESTLSLSDTLFLNKLNEGCLPKEEDGSSSSVSGLVSNPSDFNLSDGTSISALLQIASDADLAFSFNSRRTAEYCFSSNQRAGRSVVFSDTGPEIRVAQKIGDEEICVETWRKSDWSQFCWAVRGTCLHFLKN